jgi:hypothetical protein
MSQFPTSGPLSMATIAEGLGVPTNIPYSMNDFRGKTLYNTDNSTYEVPSLPTPLSIQYFYGRYYTPFPIYVLINNDGASTTLSYAALGRYKFLDYIIVGGGGGGGSGSTDTRYNGGGGGGSGYLKSSMTYTGTSQTFSETIPLPPPFPTYTFDYNYQYNITTITDVGGTLSIPSNITNIIINIGSGGPAGTGGGDGTNGGETSISFDSTLKVSTFGGNGGVGGGDTEPPPGNRGDGADGYNGGGGAIGGRPGTGGDGDTTNGGSNGDNAPNNDQPGTGGGTGGGWDPSAPDNFNESNENAGGGGGGGSAVRLYIFNWNPPVFSDGYVNTGGNGAGCYLSLDNIDSSPGAAYTGGGGGGGGQRVVAAGQLAGGSGGKGYAILYFH